MISRTYIQQYLLLFLLFLAAGCSSSDEEERGELPEDGALVRIDVSAPTIDGWQTAPDASTRLFDNNETSYSCTTDENTHLIMSVHTDRERAKLEDEPSRDTRAYLREKVVFRVVAYRCATKNKISASNYAGYGEYKMINETGTAIAIENKEMFLQNGVYTFVCYSHGRDTLPTFSSAATSLDVLNGVKFMATIKEGITISTSRYVSSYTLSDISFTHQCARISLYVLGDDTKMANITACEATLTLSKSTASYSFTDGSFTASGNSGKATVTWGETNDINVRSLYMSLLPQPAADIKLKLNMTIGGRDFKDVEVTIPNQVLVASAGYICNITLSFTGYIVGGALWAPGNLIGTAFYGTSEGYSGTPLGGDYWNWNTLDPTNYTIAVTTWNENNDPCRKVRPLNYWRSPSSTELSNLAHLDSREALINGINGRLYADLIFLPMPGWRMRGAPQTVTMPNQRGLYWSCDGGSSTASILEFTLNGSHGVGGAHSDEGLSIRCVKN